MFLTECLRTNASAKGSLEHEAAEVLGIPYEQVMQAALVPVAYTLGTDFQPAARKPVESVLHWEHW